jgi:hypothetical protein
VLRDRWYETLLLGARFLLLDSSGKPWSDKELAIRTGAEFRNMLRKAKVESMTGFQRGILRMNAPRVM